MSQTIKHDLSIKTTWELRTYDVWGNARDGYDVNDSYVFAREYELVLPITVYNAGMEGEFIGAAPTDRQIRKAFGFTNFRMDIDGDDLTIYITMARDGRPMGEMHCTSHASLSPIRAL